MTILIRGLWEEEVEDLKWLYGSRVANIPSHGRLIDADALESTLNKMGIWGDARVKGFIRSIPTVIPADKDGET